MEVISVPNSDTLTTPITTKFLALVRVTLGCRTELLAAILFEKGFFSGCALDAADF